jgi:hypothetical protein
MKELRIFIVVVLGLAVAFGIFACDRNSEEARKKELHKVFRQFVDMAFGCEPVTEDSISEILPLMFFTEEEKDKIPSIIAKFKRISEMQENEEKLAAFRDLAEMDEAAAKKKFEEMERHRKENCDERIKAFEVGKGDGNLTRIEVALETSRRMTGIEMSACKIKGDWYLLNDVAGDMHKTMLSRMKDEYVEECAGKEYLIAQKEQLIAQKEKERQHEFRTSVSRSMRPAIEAFESVATGKPVLLFANNGAVHTCVEQLNAPADRKCRPQYHDREIVKEYNSVDDVIELLIRHHNDVRNEKNVYDGSPLFATDVNAKGNVILHKLSDDRVNVYFAASDGAMITNAVVDTAAVDRRNTITYIK